MSKTKRLKEQSNEEISNIVKKAKLDNFKTFESCHISISNKREKTGKKKTP